MNRHYLKFNITVLFLTILLYSFFILLNAFFYKDYGSSLWVNNIYDKKIEYANSIKAPKMVVIGGSNVLFSIKTEEMEKSLNIPVVNAGTNAGIGLPYLLYRAQKDFVKPNDIVMLSIEYDLFKNELSASKELFKYVRTFDTNYYQRLTLKDKLKGLIKLNLNDFIKYLSMEQKIKKKGIKAVANELYNSDNLTKNGDQLKNKGQKTEDFNRRNKLFKCFKKRLDHKTGSMKKFLEFVNWCHQNNIKIIYNFPTLPYHEEYSNTEYNVMRSDLINLFKSLNIDLLDTSDIYFMENDNFYDTDYHLNYKGRKIKTTRIIEELKKLPCEELKCKKL